MNAQTVLASTLIGLVCLTAGCSGRTRPTTRPATVPAMATNIDPQTADAAYWLAMPPTAAVRSRDYAALMREADHVLRQRRFEIGRLDYRGGLLVSKPLVSKQLWEPWRNDVATGQQVLASTVATYRRTVHWDVRPADGEYAATPAVVVERVSGTPRRVSTVTGAGAGLSTAEGVTGLPTSRLEDVPADQWYAVGRDSALERELADDLSARLQKLPPQNALQRPQAAGSK